MVEAATIDAAAGTAKAVETPVVAPVAAAPVETAKAVDSKPAVVADTKPAVVEAAKVDPAADAAKAKADADAKQAAFDESIKARDEKLLSEAKAAWDAQVAADADLGGANLVKTKELCEKGLVAAEKQIPGFRQFITESHFAGHPMVLKTLRLFAQLDAEDSPLRHDGSNKADVDPRKLFYPTMTKG